MYWNYFCYLKLCHLSRGMIYCVPVLGSPLLLSLPLSGSAEVVKSELLQGAADHT